MVMKALPVWRGRLIVGQRYAKRLNLMDAELAMLISHEMQHAIQRHNQKEMEEVIRRNPSWADRPFADLEEAVDNDMALMTELSDFNALQETEADEQGLLLAQRAGWDPGQLVNFFKKVARASVYPNFSSLAHPAPSARWSHMRAFVSKLH